MPNSDDQIRYMFLQQRPKSLLGQILAFVVGVTVLAVSFVFGAFLLTALFGLILIVTVVVLARGWWLRRKMMSGAYGTESTRATSATNDGVIDADYTVVDKHRK
jgi:hypothetical protein